MFLSSSVPLLTTRFLLLSTETLLSDPGTYHPSTSTHERRILREIIGVIRVDDAASWWRRRRRSSRSRSWSFLFWIIFRFEFVLMFWDFTLITFNTLQGWLLPVGVAFLVVLNGKPWKCHQCHNSVTSDIRSGSSYRHSKSGDFPSDLITVLPDLVN